MKQWVVQLLGHSWNDFWDAFMWRTKSSTWLARVKALCQHIDIGTTLECEVCLKRWVALRILAKYVLY